jgi:hypothetical protein
MKTKAKKTNSYTLFENLKSTSKCSNKIRVRARMRIDKIMMRNKICKSEGTSQCLINNDMDIVSMLTTDKLISKCCLFTYYV